MNKNAFSGIIAQKMLFCERFGLESAVLNGYKTMTRRIVKLKERDEQYLNEAFDLEFRKQVIIDEYSRFKKGDLVAVAQSYEAVYKESPEWFKGQLEANGDYLDNLKDQPGWTNKMFTSSYYLRHRIQILSVDMERLQDISDEDCMREGISIFKDQYSFNDTKKEVWVVRNTPFRAFAELIDRLSGKGTWESNPWVFVYKFVLTR